MQVSGFIDVEHWRWVLSPPEAVLVSLQVYIRFLSLLLPKAIFIILIFAFWAHDLLKSGLTGGVIHPIFVNNLIGQVGFPGAIRYTSLLLGVCLVPVCLFVRARLPQKKWDPTTVFFDRTLLRQPSFSFYTFGCCFVLYDFAGPHYLSMSYQAKHTADRQYH